MQASNLPARFTFPFGNSAGVGYIRTVPVGSQIGIQDGAASFTDGFPPDCFLADIAGGVPPFGQDFNGLLNVITKWLWFLQAGQSMVYNASFQATIGGYPAGAVLRKLDNTAWFVNLVDNNMTDPETGGANWGVVGTSTVFGRTGHVVAAAGDYRLDMLTATDILTGNGYQKGAGTRIDQWCEVAAGSAPIQITVSYPIAFPSHSNIPRVSIYDPSGIPFSGGSNSNELIASVDSYSLTGCVVDVGFNGGGTRAFTLCVDVRGT